MVEDLSTPDDLQAANIAAIPQHTRPDIVILNEFDYVEIQRSSCSAPNYLLLSQNGAQPIDYPYFFVAPSNTGVPSGFDLDNDGTTGYPTDAFCSVTSPASTGWSCCPASGSSPTRPGRSRTSRGCPSPAPGCPRPAYRRPADWYRPTRPGGAAAVVEVALDAPIDVDGRIIHILASHPTPPPSTARRTATGCATPTRSGSGSTTSPEPTLAGSSTTSAPSAVLAADAVLSRRR